MKKLHVVFITLLILLLSIDSVAQITIDGTITDADSTPINDALVEIIDQDDTTNYYSATTNETGYFNIANIFTEIGTAQTSLPSDFVVLRNYPKQIGYHHKGSMTVVIDPLTKNLRYFETDEVRDVDWGIVATEKMISYQLDLPPFRTNIYSYDFIEREKNAKEVMYKLEYKEVAADPEAKWEQTLIKFDWKENSYVRVYFDFDPLN